MFKLSGHKWSEFGSSFPSNRRLVDIVNVAKSKSARRRVAALAACAAGLACLLPTPVAAAAETAPALVLTPNEITLNEGHWNWKRNYTLRLATRPSGEVKVRVQGKRGVDVRSEDGGQEPPYTNPWKPNLVFTFTPDNWNRAKTLRAIAESDPDGTDETVTLTHRASGADYDSVTGDVVVKVIDDDSALLDFSPSSASVQEGSSSDYHVRLNTWPNGTLTVTVSGASNGVTVDTDGNTDGNQNTLTFNNRNWGQWQAVSVFAADDANRVDEAVTLRHSVSGGTVPVNEPVREFTVNVRDDDKPAFRLSRPSAFAGEGVIVTSSYQVRLATQPSADVTMTIAPSTPSEKVKVDTDRRTQGYQNTLVFTPSNWDTAREVTVTITKDNSGTSGYVQLDHTAVGGGYDSITADTRLYVVNNALPAFHFTPSSLALTEGSSSSYRLRMEAQPSSDVTVTLSVTGPSNGVTFDTDSNREGNQNTLTFTTENWSALQTVKVTAAEDANQYEDWVVLTHRASGGGYDVRPVVKNLDVRVADNDTQALLVTAESFTIAQGSWKDYSVRLATRPAGDVTVRVTGATNSVSVTPSTLTFRHSNWNKYQTVTVSAVEESNGVDETVTLTNTASGGGYDRASAKRVEVTVDDDQKPTLRISRKTITMDEGSQATYKVRFAQRPSRDREVVVDWDTDRIQVKPNRLTFTTDNWNRDQTVTVTAHDYPDDTEGVLERIVHVIEFEESRDDSQHIVVNVLGGGTPPSRPTALSLAPGNASLTARWSAPTADGGAALTDYDVRYRPTDASLGSGWTELDDSTWNTATTATITGLTNGARYEVQVRAQSDDGAGDWSESVAAVPVAPTGPPTAATGLVVTSGDNSGELLVRWTAASRAPNGYSVRWREQDAHPRTLTSRNEVSGTSFTISGLTDGTTYFVRVDTYNLAGDGIQSGTKVTGSGTPRTPNQPPTLQAFNDQVADPGRTLSLDVRAADADAADRLRFKASSSDTTKVTVTPTEFTDYATDPLSQLSLTLVDPGTASVTVTVSDGTAEVADIFVVTVAKRVLATPSVSVQAEDGQLQATWAAVTGASSYEVEYREADATTWIDNSDDTSPALIANLANGQEYEVQVRAKAASGSTSYVDSPWSTLARGTPVEADVAPSFAAGASIPKQTWTVGTAVNLTLPAATGGNGALSYALTPDLPAGVTLDASTRTLSGAPTAAADEAAYTWRAADGDGNAEDSDTAALTFKLRVNKGALAAPSVQLAVGDAQLTATWGNVANAGSYVLQWKEATVTGWDAQTGVNTVDPATSGQVLSGLKNGAAHDVRVKAKAGANSANHVDSAWSETAKGTPAEADVAPSFAAGESILNQAWTVGTAVNLTLPAATGGNGTLSYTLTPDLPAGVTLDASTRTLSGAPTAVANATTYTWRAADGDSNAANSDTAALTFTVTVTKPALASPSNLRLSVASLGPDGFTIYWNRVPNASGYVVTATAAGAPAVTAEAWDTETGKEALFTGLTAGTAYEVSVTATGDENYADSAPATISVTTQALDQPQGQAPTLSYSPPPTKLTVGTTIETMRAHPDNFESAPSQAYFSPFSRSFQQPLAPTPIDPASDDEQEQEPAPFAYEPHFGVQPPPTPIDGGEQLDDGLSYRVNPDLPPGLQLDRDTGEISGAPSEASDSPTQVMVTATLGSGANAPTASTSITFPPVGAAALASPTSLELKPDTLTTTTFAVQWAAVPNASGYRATATASGGSPVSGDVSGTEAAFTGLATGTDYTVSVTATGNANDQDNPAATLTVTTATPSGPPTAVSEVSVRPGDNSGELRVSWKAASHAPNGYSVRWREQAEHPRNLTSRNEVSGASFTISGLTDGTLYFVRVDTYNAAGNGIERGTKVTGSGTPRAPKATNQIPTLQAFNDQVADPGRTLNLDVRAADADAGDTLRYKASSSDDTKITVTPTEFTDYATSPLSQVSLTLVNPGTASVTVTVSDGTAEVTDTFVVTVGKYVLATPSMSVTAQDGQLQATWAAVTGASSYEVEYRKTGETTWVDSSDDTSPALITGLTNGQEYEVQVRAKAASGSTSYVDSPWSTLARGTPVEGDVAPSFPAGTVTQHQTWTVGAAVNLTLPAATDGTGNGALSYTLTPDLPAGVTLDASTRTLSGAPTAVASTSHYTWRVADSDGNVADSDTAALTFAVTVNKGTLATPTNLRVKAGSLTRTGFRLTWDAVANASDYVATATAYEKTVNAAVTGAEAEFTGLTMNIAYDVAVKAVGNAIYADSAAQTMSVTTAANESPYMKGIDDREGGVGTTLTLDVSAWDTESDPLRYEAYSSDETKVTVTPTEFTDYSASPASQVSLTLVGVGRTDVTVTVSDGMAQTASSFYVQVNEAASQAPPVSSGPPTAVTGVSVEPGDNSGELAVSWSAASHAPNGYSVRWREKGPGKSLSAINSVAGTSFTISGLTDGTAYIVRVDTYNAAGDGLERGAKAVGSGVPRTPDAPQAATNQAPTITSINDQSATFGANLAVDVDASDADGDDLRYKAVSDNPAVATVTPLVLTDHDGNSQVAVTPVGAGTATVTVTLSDGKLEASETFNVTISLAALASPSPSLEAGDGQLTATWTDVNKAASYQVQYRESGSDTWTDSSDNTSPAVIESLANGTEHEVRVRAKAAAGSTTHADGAWSTTVKDTPVEADVAPSFAAGATVPNQTWRVGETVNLALPEATGGNGTLSYALTPDLPTGLSLDSTTNTLSGAPTAVADAATYTWRVSDSDGNSEDADSATLTFSVTIGKGALQTPANLALKADTLTATSFTVSWDAVTNASRYTATATASGATVTGEVTGTEAAFTGLEESAEYTVSVTATGNANYEDSAAQTLSVTTLTPVSGPPTAVTGLAAVAGDAPDKLVVTWTAASHAPHGYIVRWRKTNGGRFAPAQVISSGQKTTYTITGLESGTRYRVRLDSRNADGSRASGTAVSKDGTTHSGEPTAVTGLSVAPGDNAGELVVTWTAATYAPHGYNLRWRKTAGGKFAPTQVISSGQTTTYTITGLDDETRYRVRLDTRKADGARVLGTAVSKDGATRSSLSLRIDDAQGDEGDTLGFRLRLSQAAGHAVTVHWRTESGSAQAGQDFDAGSGSLTFKPGETQKTVQVRTLDDAHDDSGETFRVLLSDAEGAAVADGEAVGTIRNDDPMPSAWLGHFGRAVAEQALDGITERMVAAPASGTQMTLAGRAFGGRVRSDGAGRFGAGETAALGGIGGDGFAVPWDMGMPHAERSLTGREALVSSRFTLTGEADESGGYLSFWGRGAQSDFDGEVDRARLDGKVTTMTLGSDYARGRWLTGLALTRSEGEGGYRRSEVGLGQVESSLSAAIPYASLAVSERLRVWGAVGYGLGTVTLTPDNGADIETDMDWGMLAGGLRHELAASSLRSVPALTLVSDGLWTRTASEQALASGSHSSLLASASAVTRLRLGVEASWSLPQSEGGGFTPKLEAGVRHDGGDLGSGFGVELGGGFRWMAPRWGLSFDVAGRTLLAHELAARRDRGFSAALGFDPRPGSARGWSLSLRQEMGSRSEGGLDALFASAPLDVRARGDSARRWTAEAAYGVPIFGGRFTGSPTLGVEHSELMRDYRVGWRLEPWALAPELSLDITAARREIRDAAPAHRVGLEIQARW